MFDLRIGAFVIAILFATNALGGEIPMDQSAFTEYMASLLRKEAGNDAVTIKGPLTLKYGELQANLDRVFAFCKNNNQSDCSDELSRYVQAVARVKRQLNAAPEKDAVRLAVRTAEYVHQFGSSTHALQPRSLVGDLVLLPVLDSRMSIRMLTDKDNAALGMDIDAVYQLALNNTHRDLRPVMESAKVAEQGKIGKLIGNTYESSQLAFHDDWAPLARAQAGKLIVVAPVKDAIFYVGDDSPAAVDALRTYAHALFTRAPNPLSETLLRWTATGWEVVPLVP